MLKLNGHGRRWPDPRTVLALVARAIGIDVARVFDMSADEFEAAANAARRARGS